MALISAPKEIVSCQSRRTSQLRFFSHDDGSQSLPDLGFIPLPPVELFRVRRTRYTNQRHAKVTHKIVLSRRSEGGCAGALAFFEEGGTERSRMRLRLQQAQSANEAPAPAFRPKRIHDGSARLGM